MPAIDFLTHLLELSPEEWLRAHGSAPGNEPGGEWYRWFRSLSTPSVVSIRRKMVTALEAQIKGLLQAVTEPWKERMVKQFIYCLFQAVLDALHGNGFVDCLGARTSKASSLLQLTNVWRGQPTLYFSYPPGE